MNGHELWRLRELGIAGIQVQKQESNFWSKYNCPVLRWTGENPRHGFGGNELMTMLREKRNRTSVVGREFTCKRPSCPLSEPPAKQRRLLSSLSQQEHSRPASPPPKGRKSVGNSPSSGSLDRLSSTGRGNWYFISSTDGLRETCAGAFPQFAQERHVDLGHSNKIFAARWLDDDRIVMGTKCNSILIMDADSKKAKYRKFRPRIYDDDDEWMNEGPAESQRRSWMSSSPITKIQPLKGSSVNPPHIDQNCGIHAIDVNPSGTMFASGGDNPADISVFRLPNFEPLTVGETAHNDWLFDLEWLDDEYLVSGSRDSTLALWRFPSNPEDVIVCSHSSRGLVKSRDRGGGRVGRSQERTNFTSIYGCSVYPSSRPIEVQKLQRFDKVRALKFNHRHKVLTSVSLNSYLHVLDITTFKQRLLRRMDGYNECVCLCNSPDEDLLAVGSRTSFALYDTRTWEKVGEEKLPRRSDEDPHSVQSMMPSGVRSASWRGHMLTLGTGGGEIMFYDVRAKKFLQCDCNRSLTLRITGGWLQQDEIYQEIFLNLPCPNAVYAHCYDEYGTRLFAAGGPIAASLVGNYAAMWG